MSRVSFPILTFQLPTSQPVANGSIQIRLNTDGAAQNQQISAADVTLPLSSNGTLSSSYLFWSNADISPTGSYYIYHVYTSTGELVSGPNLISL